MEEVCEQYLEYDDETDPCPQVSGGSIHPSHHVHHGLTNSDHHTEHCTERTEVTEVTHNQTQVQVPKSLPATCTSSTHSNLTPCTHIDIKLKVLNVVFFLTHMC